MTVSPKIYALIVAAGTGTRAGGEVPKQYRVVGDKPLLRYSCEAFSQHPGIAGIQVVILPEHHERYQAATDGMALLPPVYGGTQRSDSVRAGLNALSHYQPDFILIHDAARPFLPQAVLNALIAKLKFGRAVVPAIPVADTVRRLVDDKWTEVARDGLMRIQTPQAFPFEQLRVLDSYSDAQVTDEAALWLASGLPLDYVLGDEELHKMTTAEDLNRAHAPRTSRRVAIGMGYDVHALMPAGDKHSIRLGGVDIDHSYKLHGHSDADVVLHALVDGLLGAIAEGDIGSHFPPTDPQWKGADSKQFVEHARARVAAHGGLIHHVDLTIVCEMPKVGPHREKMREVIAGLLHVPINRVSVKATTTEKLGFTGRSEGIAAHALVTVLVPEA